MRTHTHTHTLTHAHMHICTHIHTFKHTHIHRCTHTPTHTQAEVQLYNHQGPIQLLLLVTVSQFKHAHTNAHTPIILAHAQTHACRQHTHVQYLANAHRSPFTSRRSTHSQAVCCVPVMLFGVPCVTNMKYKSVSSIATNTYSDANSTS